MADYLKTEISRAQQAEAKFIRDGGLRIDSQYPQVHESSWEPLAIINERGILTYGSQDAIDSESGDVKDYERSYIQACMLDTEETYQIVERFNLWSDSMIAYICVKVNETVYSKNRTSKIATSLRFHDNSWFASMSLRLVQDPQWNRMMRSEFGLRKRVPIVNVCFIDAKWGRPATADNGLFNAVLEALDTSVIHIRRPPPYTRS